jgi:hypothetical protein
MHTSHWKQMVTGALILGSLASAGFAQDPRPAARQGFVATLERRVGLTPEQSDAVRGLLAEQRQKSQNLREDTDRKIRALLNSEQQKKFDQVLAEQKANRATRNRG